MTQRKNERRPGKPTRNGCRTCRLRKVKCDENKPACARCASTGRVCDGEIGSSTIVTTTRTILSSRSSSTSTNGASTSASSSQWTPSASGSPPSTFLVKIPDWQHIGAGVTDYERFGFQHFHELTGPALQVILPSPEWVRLAKQVGTYEPAVFHAIAATGTMARGLTVLMHPTFARPIDKELERLASQQYGEAIRKLRDLVDTMVSSRTTVEPVLLACLLCVCFETLRGRNSAAMQHAGVGRKIAKECSAKSTLENSPSARFFESITQMTGDSSALFHNKEHHHDDCCRMQYHKIPATFHNIEEASLYLNMISKAGEHLRSELLGIANTQHAVRSATSVASPDAFRFCLSACLSRTVATSAAQQSQLRYLRRAHARWSDMYTIYEQALAPERIKAAHLVLRIQHFYSSFALETCRVTEETLSDVFVPQFERTLNLVERYLLLARPGLHEEQETSKSLQPSFFGPSILPSLNLIAHKCRDPLQRQRALVLLSKANKREGLEDSVSLAYYTQAVAALEEQRSKSRPQYEVEVTGSLSLPELARFCDIVTVGAGARGIFRLVCARYVHEEKGDTQIEMSEYEGGAVPLRISGQQRVVV